jgi:hypothetical protein
VKKEPIRSMVFIKPINIGGKPVSSLEDDSGPYSAEIIAFPWIRITKIPNPAVTRRTTIFNVADAADWTDEIESTQGAAIKK